jgi:hypothetical protein
MIGLTDFNQLDLNPTSTHQHTECDFMQEVVHVLQVGDDGDAGGDGNGDDSDEDGGTGEELCSWCHVWRGAVGPTHYTCARSD